MNNEMIATLNVEGISKEELKELEKEFRQSTPNADKVLEEIHQVLKSKCYIDLISYQELKNDTK